MKFQDVLDGLSNTIMVGETLPRHSIHNTLFGVFLTPQEVAPGQPEIPGFASLEPSGTFVAECNLGQGLVPGKYRVAVQCWELEPDDTRARNPGGISVVPAKYRSPATSGLEFEVPRGHSGAVEVTFDLPKKS